MNDETTERQAELDEEMLRIVKKCVTVCLISLEARLADPQRDDPNEKIGKIWIIVDEEEGISTALKRQRQDPKNGVFILKVPSRSAGYGMELTLAEWAYSPQALATVIAELDPRYTNPEWLADLSIATEEVAEVLLGAAVIEQGSPMHLLLCQAAKKPFPDKRRAMPWFSI